MRFSARRARIASDGGIGVDSALCSPNLRTMEIRPTPDQEELIRHAIASGRIGRPEEAGQEAMALWEERERARAEILAAIDAAEASLARDAGFIITPDSMRRLAEEVKQRGRARLAAEKARG
jgi:hypothetical protein